MKKYVLIILSLMVVFMNQSFCSASEFDKQFEIARKAYCVTPYELAISKSGITCDVIGMSFDVFYDHKQPVEVIYGTKMRAACIVGFGLKIKNTSQNVVAIDWKNSSICVDNNAVGVPFFSGMKFVDAGKPDVLVNDILPPNTTIEKIALLPTVRLRDGDFDFSTKWVYDGAILFRHQTRKFDYYIAIDLMDGNKEYLHVNIPPITAPLS